MMLIDQAMWEKFFKGFYIYDATYGFNHGRIGLLLNEEVDEDHEEYDDPWYIPHKKLISIVIDNPPETRIFSMHLGHRPLTTISSGWAPSQSELVIAANDCQVISYKTREYKGPENKIDTSIPGFKNVRVAISKLVRVGTSVYSICTGLRIYKRINHQIWKECTQDLPIPDEYIKCTADGIINNILYDLAGFSESDMYAVEGMGSIYHFNGINWRKIPFHSNKNLHTVCCAGDKFVYISDSDGSIWKGRNNEWTRIIDHGTLLWPFDSMVWFDDRLWCANHQDIKVLEENRLIFATQAKYKPLPDEVDSLGEYVHDKSIEVSPDGTIMMVCGSRGVALYNGNEWNVLFNLWKF